MSISWKMRTPPAPGDIPHNERLIAGQVLGQVAGGEAGVEVVAASWWMAYIDCNLLVGEVLLCVKAGERECLWLGRLA